MPAASPSTERDEVAAIVADDVDGLGGRRRAGRSRSSPAAICCPAGSTCAAAARGCPRSAAALEAERFWKHLPFARPPEVSIMAPDQVASIVDATHLLVDQQDVTPLGLAHQAIELQSTEDPLDAALRRVLRAMKV